MPNIGAVPPVGGAQPPTGPAATGGDGFIIAYHGIHKAVNRVKRALVQWLAIIDALVELYKKEQAINAATSKYYGQWTDAPTKANKENAKAILEALAELKKFLKGGYKQFGKGLGPKVLARIKGLVDQAAYGTGKQGSDSIIEVLESLAKLPQGSSKKYLAALKKWLDSPADQKSFNAFLGMFSEQLFNSRYAVESRPDVPPVEFWTVKGWQKMIQQCHNYNVISKDMAQKESATIESLIKGWGNLIKKAYELVLAMIKLIPG